MRRKELVELARSWKGTPFHHQGRIKGVGTDCTGFLIGVLDEAGIATPPDLPFYDRRPRGEELDRRLASVFEEIPREEAKPGDLLTFRSKYVQHIAMLTGEDSIIHAVEGYGVVEIPIDQMWKKRYHKAYRMNRVTD